MGKNSSTFGGYFWTKHTRSKHYKQLMFENRTSDTRNYPKSGQRKIWTADIFQYSLAFILKLSSSKCPITLAVWHPDEIYCSITGLVWNLDLNSNNKIKNSAFQHFFLTLHPNINSKIHHKPAKLILVRNLSPPSIQC